jgi:hypothetical protein
LGESNKEDKRQLINRPATAKVATVQSLSSGASVKENGDKIAITRSKSNSPDAQKVRSRLSLSSLNVDVAIKRNNENPNKHMTSTTHTVSRSNIAKKMLWH